MERRRAWLWPLREVTDPEAHLVCFPHSGGSASYFRSWLDVLPGRLGVSAVQYPGRGGRILEEPVADVRVLASSVAAELAARPPVPLVLFGHSLGALVAFETARALGAGEPGAPAPLLGVSGCAAPDVHRGGRLHLAGDDDLWDTIGGLGGLGPGTSPELRDLLLPALRADVRACEAYAPGAARVRCEIRCFAGADDPLVTPPDLDAWRAYTSAACVIREIPGGHFPGPEGVAAIASTLFPGVPAGRETA